MGNITTLDVLKALEADAILYRATAAESILRNHHMNEAAGVDRIDQRIVDALLVDFINFVAARRGVDYAMYARDLGPLPEPDKENP